MLPCFYIYLSDNEKIHIYMHCGIALSLIIHAWFMSRDTHLHHICVYYLQDHLKKKLRKEKNLMLIMFMHLQYVSAESPIVLIRILCCRI